MNRSNDIGLKYSQTKFAPNEFGKIIEVKGFETININKYILGDFYKIDKPYKTKNKNFYAIQQDYLLDNDINKRFHISIIYRQNKDFTRDELDYLLKINLDNIIKKNDLIIKVMNCNSIFPEEWTDLTLK